MNKSSSSSVSFNNFDVNLIESNNYKPGFKTNFKVLMKFYIFFLLTDILHFT